jgi:hypothetical protein
LDSDTTTLPSRNLALNKRCCQEPTYVKSKGNARLSDPDLAELRDRAKAEILELGPEPANPRERELWIEERRGTVVLLSALADYDAELLRRAATDDWVSPAARNLLLAAATERRR